MSSVSPSRPNSAVTSSARVAKCRYTARRDTPARSATSAMVSASKPPSVISSRVASSSAARLRRLRAFCGALIALVTNAFFR